MEKLFERFQVAKAIPVSEAVYDFLRTAIIQGEIFPNERLVQDELAEKLKVSRTPVRDALRKLESEGLVEYVPKKGFINKGITTSGVVELYAIRERLESLAVRYVAEIITKKELNKLEDLDKECQHYFDMGDKEKLLKMCKDLNEELTNLCKQPRLIFIIKNMSDYCEMTRRTTMFDKERQIEVIREHSGIIEAIRDRNADKAEGLVIKHLRNAKNHFLKNYYSKLQSM